MKQQSGPRALAGSSLACHPPDTPAGQTTVREAGAGDLVWMGGGCRGRRTEAQADGGGAGQDRYSSEPPPRPSPGMRRESKATPAPSSAQPPGLHLHTTSAKKLTTSLGIPSAAPTSLLRKRA